VRTRVPDMLFYNSIRSEFAGLESPLYGSRLPLFAHDEILGEHPLSIAPEAATRIAEVMRDCMRYACPTHADAAFVEPTLMDCWNKQAACVRDANGRLMVWQPKQRKAAA
jgi:hypothetical protein